MDTVYKVVTTYSGKLMSAIVGPNDGEWFLEYEIGQTTLPIGNSYIFAFDNLEHATRFAALYMSKNDEILECEAEIVEGSPLLSGTISIAAFEGFWSRDDNLDVWSGPTGTVACKWVKPKAIMK